MIKFLAITTICVVLTHARRINWQDEDFDASYRPRNLKILSHMNGLYDEERDYGEMTERGLGSLFTPRSMGRQTLKWNRIGSLPPARIGRLRSRRQRRRNRLGRNRKYRWEGEDETDMQIPDYPRPMKRNRRLMERYRLANPRKFSTMNGEEDDEGRERRWRYRKRYRPRFLGRNRKFRWEEEDETERPRRYRKRYRPRLLGRNRKYRWEDADENDIEVPFSPEVKRKIEFIIQL
ncbi:hypothetical protein NECAME_14082, partial [Necator americanus]